jgi:hypothetical protein
MYDTRRAKARTATRTLPHPPTPTSRVQTAAFNWLEEQTRLHGDVLPWSLVTIGFGDRQPLGRKPQVWKCERDTRRHPSRPVLTALERNLCPSDTIAA